MYPHILCDLLWACCFSLQSNFVNLDHLVSQLSIPANFYLFLKLRSMPSVSSSRKLTKTFARTRRRTLC